MWPWIKRWRDWAMSDFWPFSRLNPQPQAIHYSYEKAGLLVHDQPIPWNADSVSVDARLQMRGSAGRRNYWSWDSRGQVERRHAARLVDLGNEKITSRNESHARGARRAGDSEW